MTKFIVSPKDTIHIGYFYDVTVPKRFTLSNFLTSLTRELNSHCINEIMSQKIVAMTLHSEMSIVSSMTVAIVRLLVKQTSFFAITSHVYRHQQRNWMMSSIDNTLLRRLYISSSIGCIIVNGKLLSVSIIVRVVVRQQSTTIVTPSEY
jgi:hypothetical protein